jgi:RNA-directed DNA polymerase
MRRHGDLFKTIVDTDNLRLAYLRARKGKMWQRQIKAFDANVENNLQVIRQGLIDNTFHTSAYHVKTIHEPKEREIHVLPFNPDRIVQHAVMNVLEPIWESFFIDDSYACRKGKGVHAGSTRTMEFVRRNSYCLKCDIRKFYPSIHHDTLFEIVQRKIKCPDTLRLLRDIIYSVEGEQNVPIGNYTSQWFGNLYMNELDQYLKHAWKIKDYIRYCDDFLLFHNDKGFLNSAKQAITSFLQEKLKLRLSKDALFPVSQGVDFLGYRHFRSYILLRKSTVKRMKKRIARLIRMACAGQISAEYITSSLASTKGWLQWANCRNLNNTLGIDALAEATCGA